jgi:hypothetical protein
MITGAMLACSAKVGRSLFAQGPSPEKRQRFFAALKMTIAQVILLKLLVQTIA